HTRCYRDWSSDVCSSDLSVLGSSVSLPQVVHDPPRYSADNALVKGLLTAMHHPSRLFPSRNGRRLRWRYEHDGFDGLFDHRHRKIGRASCRERASMTGVA